MVFFIGWLYGTRNEWVLLTASFGFWVLPPCPLLQIKRGMFFLTKCTATARCGYRML